MSSLTCAAGHAEGSEACYLASQSRLAQMSRLPGWQGLLALSMRLSMRGRDEQPHMCSRPC